MKLSIISGLLIAAGAALMGYAVLIMDVSIGSSRIVNLDMLNTRQNLVIMGAITILVGTILLATSILAGKGVAAEGIPKAAQPPGPNPIIHLADRTRRQVQAWVQQLNSWRERFFFRAAFALLCSVIFTIGSTLPWVSIVGAFLVFLTLSMRKLPAYAAVGKTCFWGFAATLPLNIAHLIIVITNDIGPWLPIFNIALTSILMGVFIKYSSK